MEVINASLTITLRTLVNTEKVSPISEIPAHHRDLVFQSNEGMTHVLIKPSQLIAITKMTI
jgi:hypothetical protein